MNRTQPFSSTQKTWVAEITGQHEKFDLDRPFLKAEATADGRLSYELADGLVYDVCCPAQGIRHFTIKHKLGTYYLTRTPVGEWLCQGVEVDAFVLLSRREVVRGLAPTASPTGIRS